MEHTTYPDCFGELSRPYPAAERTALGIQELPTDKRPRERLLSSGPAALSDQELLEVLLNTGIRGKGVAALAGELLALLDQAEGIPPVKELSRLAGLGAGKACAVAAMLEFGRRRYGAFGVKVKRPEDIFTLVRHYADRKQERFISLSLNGAHEAMAVRIVTIGLVNRTIVHPREVFADILSDRAAAFAVAHNHPSGALKPSTEDDATTARLKAAANILGIRFLEHLIFSETGWWSYRQAGSLEDRQQPEGQSGAQECAD